MKEKYMETIYRLEYKKTFKSGTKTRHIKLSFSKEKLFSFVEELCKKEELVLLKSENLDHEFLFMDVDWVYYGTSDFLNIEFCCYNTEIY